MLPNRQWFTETVSKPKKILTYPILHQSSIGSFQYPQFNSNILSCHVLQYPQPIGYQMLIPSSVALPFQQQVIPRRDYDYSRPFGDCSSSCSRMSIGINFIVNPRELGFRPSHRWTAGTQTLSEVVENFFRTRSSKRIHFIHKLWNALLLTKAYPELIPVIGVEWITNTLIKVNRDIFAALLNISKPTSALFNIQGSFSSHGFTEVSVSKAIENGAPPSSLSDVDESLVRLFMHSQGLFQISSTSSDIQKCSWKSVSL